MKDETWAECILAGVIVVPLLLLGGFAFIVTHEKGEFYRSHGAQVSDWQVFCGARPNVVVIQKTFD